MIYFFKERGTPLSWNEWKLSPDMKYILMKADRLKVRLSWSFIFFEIIYISSNGDTRPSATTISTT